MLHVELRWDGGSPGHLDAMCSVIPRAAHGTTRTVQWSDGSVSIRAAVQAWPGTDPAHSVSADELGLDVAASMRVDNAPELARQHDLPANAPPGLVIAATYSRMRSRAACEILGDGVVAIWDRRARELVCWRDAVGVRPLYYFSSARGDVVLSTDLEALRANPLVSRTVDLSYARMLLLDPSLQHPSRTLLDGVGKLEAGHLLTAGNGPVRVTRYWDPETIRRDTGGDPAEYLAEARRVLAAAVACRMPATGALGAHVSGGLDSSTIASLAARMATDRTSVTGFSWAPSYERVPVVPRDERALAESAAKNAGIELRFNQQTPNDLLAFETMDLATHPATTLQFELATSRDASSLGVDTMLSGWGGDQTLAFNGRGYFAELARSGRMVTLGKEILRRSALHKASRLGMVRARVVQPFATARRAARAAQPGLASLPPLPAALKPGFAAALAGIAPLSVTSLDEVPGVSRMQLAALFQGHVQYRTESWAAHGARVGIRYEFPMLDRRVVEFALRAPGAFFFASGWKRWGFRRAFEGILPPEVCWNAHKFDTAMSYLKYENVRALPPLGRAALRGRRSNPFLDVDKVIEMSDSESADSSVRATWLAFLSLTYV